MSSVLVICLFSACIFPFPGLRLMHLLCPSASRPCSLRGPHHIPLVATVYDRVLVSFYLFHVFVSIISSSSAHLNVVLIHRNFSSFPFSVFDTLAVMPVETADQLVHCITLMEV